MRFARRLRASQEILPLTWVPPYEILCRRIPMRFARRLRASQEILPLTRVPPYEILFKAFHFAHRYLIGYSANHLVVVDTFLIFSALYPSPYRHMFPDLKFSCKSRISSPAYARYVITLSILCSLRAEHQLSPCREESSCTLEPYICNHQDISGSVCSPPPAHPRPAVRSLSQTQIV